MENRHSKEIKLVVNKLRWIATIYRLVVFFTQIFISMIIDDYDKSSLFDGHENYNKSITSSFGYLFSGYDKWDSAYFNHISYEGYTYEQALAFYPLWPIVTGYTGQFLHFALIGYLNHKLCILLCNALWSSIFFIWSTELLFQVTLRLTTNTNYSYLVSLLFVINPANIFFASGYSECLFVCLTFGIIYHLEIDDPCFLKSSVLIGLASLTRSNGLLLIGLLLHRIVRKMINCPGIIKSFKEANSSDHAHIKQFFKHLITIFNHNKILFLKCFLYLPLAVCPFIIHQIWIYSKFCIDRQKSSGIWCFNYIPLSYSYIQSHYWNVGFLNYFKLQQLPNFLLATPICLIVCSLYQFYSNPTVVLKLSDLALEDRVHKQSLGQIVKFKRNRFIYDAHILALTLFGFFTIHVQVLTRLLCSTSPVIYWQMASLFYSKSPNARLYQLLTLGYVLSFAFIGHVMHCNFYPWT